MNEISNITLKNKFNSYTTCILRDGMYYTVSVKEEVTSALSVTEESKHFKVIATGSYGTKLLQDTTGKEYTSEYCNGKTLLIPRSEDNVVYIAENCTFDRPMDTWTMLHNSYYVRKKNMRNGWSYLPDKV